jgi:hypothetical protein
MPFEVDLEDGEGIDNGGGFCDNITVSNKSNKKGII